MIRRPYAVALTALLLALTGCAGEPYGPETPASAQDREIADARELGRFAMDRGRYADAARMFARGLSQARARDDIAVIADLGYARALATLRGGDAKAAVEQAGQLRRELVRRGEPVPPALDLVLAQAHSRLGAPERSAAAARRVLARSQDPVLAGRAHYLLGMIAADRGDLSALSRAHAALADARAPALIADRDLLAGRRALARGQASTALARFQAAAERRRTLGDEMGMARALAFAGRAARGAGQSAQAADLYYRAGRTAFLRERAKEASGWLEAAVKAAQSAGEAALADDACALLEDLRTGYTGSAAARARSLSEKPCTYCARATAASFCDRSTHMGTTMLVSRSEKPARCPTRSLRRRLLGQAPRGKGTGS